MRIASVVALCFGLLLFTSTTSFGQSAAPSTKGVPGKAAKDAHEGHSHDEHDHPAHGPHDGELLEVGKEEYHVELCIDDEKKQVFVFLLDKEAKAYVAIEQEFLAVNVKMKDGRPVQFKMKAAPQKDDKKGFSSAYGIVSPEMIDAIHDEAAEARLALKIAGKPYTVKLKHDHDHDHDHAGHDHKDHDHKKK